MKREICAAALLLFLAGGAFLNIRHVDRLTDKVLAELESSKQAAQAEETGLALKYWETSFELWEQSYSYTHVFIRHQETDAAVEDFYAIKELLLQNEADAALAAYERLSYRLSNIAAMEKPTAGAIF